MCLSSLSGDSGRPSEAYPYRCVGATRTRPCARYLSSSAGDHGAFGLAVDAPVRPEEQEDDFAIELFHRWHAGADGHSSVEVRRRMSFETKQSDVGFDPLAKRCIAVRSEGLLEHRGSLGPGAVFGQLSRLRFDPVGGVVRGRGGVDHCESPHRRTIRRAIPRTRRCGAWFYRVPFSQTHLASESSALAIARAFARRVEKLHVKPTVTLWSI